MNAVGCYLLKYISRRKVKEAASSPQAKRMVGSRKCWGPRTSRSSSGENTERAWKAARSFFSRLTIIPD